MRASPDSHPRPPSRPPSLPLVLENVTLDGARGARLLSDLSARLTAGPLTGVLGPNGAGKTLLLRLSFGLIAPSRGRIAWLGPGGDDPAARLARGMVFQQPTMLDRSVAANIAYPLRLRGWPRAVRRARTARALEIGRLDGLAGRRAPELSGGERQRLALARAWAPNPEILFLDEPTASLDPAGTAEVEGVIADLAARGVKIVMTTHDLAQARRLAEEILFLEGGELLAQGPTGALLDAPPHPAMAAFLEGRLPASVKTPTAKGEHDDTDTAPHSHVEPVGRAGPGRRDRAGPAFKPLARRARRG